ncbi:bcl-2/adenovirus E1B 19 kDa-interacting protein 2-like protein isoform X1 [Molossus molossus]|uniref:Bcl-2/adenovirus E1B 19 kDa-interacting protein 2-like protein n=2 Tax=Molossus molossus TaxID=27622 RepID=A0A7J8CPJ3_MOLMO|nr:bcl-2/adenovirus E1B 19 kDa-interacting protein 2-like protein isoform X1 [Molossus molossus]KAF6412780.1 BCL2 interacting protein like [Molossus molossus]
MGTIQEAEEKTLAVGARENAEAAGPGASLRLGELELEEEWQDEDFHRLLSEEANSSEDPEDPKRDSQAGTPSTLALCGQRPMRKRLSAPELQLDLTKPGDKGASPTYSVPSSPAGSSDLDIDELETPSDSEKLDSGHEFEWEDELPQAEGLGASEAAERLGQGCVWDVAGEDGHRWRVFRTGQREQQVDMTVIEPYKKVLSHGGYHGDGLNAVILFASCYLPRSSIPNYTYVMEHLFRYMVGTLELLVAENYLLVHLSGGTSRAQVPPLSWIRQCYRTLDRRLRKNLRALVVVHATWYVKAFLALLRPFISSKFTRKIRFLNSLRELAQLISLDQVHIPEAVRRLDQDLHGSGRT